MRPLRGSGLPPVQDSSWPRTRIDWFVLARMEKEGLQPAPEADERTLARRLSFALTGLPPGTGGQGTTVEALLSSPHYGERWGRHWLDLARYVDRSPDWLESTRYAYLYRDWVVDALNRDFPYDRFILWQLAADLLPDGGPGDRVALGFLGLSPTYFKELQLPPEIIKTTVADEWEEHVDAIGRTFLGLTIACARCHDHKSDPIPTEDYYALAGVFASVKLAERPIVDDALWAPVAKARAEVAALEKKIAEVKKGKPKDLAEQVAGLQKQIGEIKARTAHYDMPMANAVEDAALYVVANDKSHGTKLDYRMGIARDLELQKRGNPNDLGPVVERRFLSAFPLPDGKPRRLGSGSGRLDLARALTGEASALTARVMVNRVWKQHFGRGLVDTPSEFGRLGDPPSHPELLDDLALRFVENGWSIKWLHREILNSATWRQSSSAPRSEARDPANRFLARAARRRLDWEAWRDSLLAGAGTLDLTMGGPALAVGSPDNVRRSLYGASDRQDMDAMLRLHDVPDPGAHSPWRTETMTPLQGLFALNSPFILKQSDALGAWIRQEGLEAGYRRLFQRHPADWETRAAQAYLQGREGEAAVWSGLAQVLLVSNELQFID
ncbi:MAG: DUF1553 domain-containing protein [Verrucomicrobia bacterium]|nr:DUF1553 domain-containing protein [Verrucomicrobiota bacterium]